MLTIDQILRAYDDGVITRREVFGNVLLLLPALSPETVRARLRAEPGWEEAFKEWIAAVAGTEELVSAGRPVRITEDIRAAIGRYQAADPSDPGWVVTQEGATFTTPLPTSPAKRRGRIASTAIALAMAASLGSSGHTASPDAPSTPAPPARGR